MLVVLPPHVTIQISLKAKCSEEQIYQPPLPPQQVKKHLICQRSGIPPLLVDNPKLHLHIKICPRSKKRVHLLVAH